MGRITIPNFHGGMSQRAERYRAGNEFEMVDNMTQDWAAGLSKRNPLVYKAIMDTGIDAANAFVHTFERSEEETFFIVCDGSGVQVFDTNGVERAVEIDPVIDTSYVSGLTYSPRASLRAITIGDSVLLLNREVVTRMSNDATPAVQDDVAYLFCKQTQYGYVEHDLYITDGDGVVRKASVQTARSADKVNPRRYRYKNKKTNPAKYRFLDLRNSTESVAEYLRRTINDEPSYNSPRAEAPGQVYNHWGGGNNTTIQASSTGSVLRLQDTTGKGFKNIISTDGLGDKGSSLIWKSVGSLDDLPTNLQDHGFKIRVEGSKSDLSDDFYVQYVAAGYGGLSSVDDDVSNDYTASSPIEGANEDSSMPDVDPSGSTSSTSISYDVGYWKETNGFGDVYKFKYETMPHVLVLRPDGTFVYTRMDGGLFETTATGGGATLREPFFNGGLTGAVYVDDASIFQVGDAIRFTNVQSKSDPDYKAFPKEIVEGKRYFVGFINKNTDTIFIRYSPDELGSPADAVRWDHTINYEASANITIDTYQKFKFAEREAGDSITNPEPAFINNTINDMVLFRNRLAFVSNDAVSLSEFGEFFNFWRVSVQELLATAPIEVRTTDNTTRKLKSAVNYKNHLLVFSDKAQFLLGADGPLSPENVQFQLATSYDSNTAVKPFVVGDRLYYIETTDGYHKLHEMTESQFRGNFVSTDVSEKVPNLMTGDFIDIASNGEDRIALVSESAPNRVYELYIKVLNGERVISAWGCHHLPDIDVEALSFVDNNLYVIGVLQGDKRSIWSLAFNQDFGQGFLDMRLDGSSLPNSYDAGTDQTTYTLPFEDLSSLDWKWWRSDGSTDDVVSATPTTLAVSGNTTYYSDIQFGILYKSTLAFSKFYPQSSGGTGPVVNDQLILDSFGVAFDQEVRQFFDISSVVDFGKTSVNEYRSHIIQVEDPNAIEYGYIISWTGITAGGTGPGIIDIHNNIRDYEEVSVNSRNRDVRITISSESPYPVKLINFEYNTREGGSRR